MVSPPSSYNHQTSIVPLCFFLKIAIFSNILLGSSFPLGEVYSTFSRAYFFLFLKYLPDPPLVSVFKSKSNREEVALKIFWVEI